jgi:hypothetical protein
MSTSPTASTFDENYAATPMFEAVVEAWEVSVPVFSGAMRGALLAVLAICGVVTASTRRRRHRSLLWPTRPRAVMPPGLRIA